MPFEGHTMLRNKLLYKKKRDVLIQTNTDFALECIATIISEINKPLIKSYC